MTPTDAVVAILIETKGGGPVAVRFPSAAALYKWEEAHPEVVVGSMVPLVSRKEAISA